MWMCFVLAMLVGDGIYLQQPLKHILQNIFQILVCRKKWMSTLFSDGWTTVNYDRSVKAQTNSQFYLLWFLSRFIDCATTTKVYIYILRAMIERLDHTQGFSCSFWALIWGNCGWNTLKVQFLPRPIQWKAHNGEAQSLHWIPSPESLWENCNRAPPGQESCVTHRAQWTQSPAIWQSLVCWRRNSDRSPGSLWGSHCWESQMSQSPPFSPVSDPGRAQSPVRSSSIEI